MAYTDTVLCIPHQIQLHLLEFTVSSSPFCFFFTSFLIYISLPFETICNCCECLAFAKPVGILNINTGTATVSRWCRTRFSILMRTKWRAESLQWPPCSTTAWSSIDGVECSLCYIPMLQSPDNTAVIWSTVLVVFPTLFALFCPSVSVNIPILSSLVRQAFCRLSTTDA